MQFPVPINKELPRPPRTLRVTMWVLFVLLLAGIYGPWLLQPYASPIGLTPSYSIAQALVRMSYQPLSIALYSSQYSFLVLWCVGLSVCALLWSVSQRGWGARAISCLPLGLLVIAPLVVSQKYGSYNTLEYFEAPSGYEVNWITQPESDLAGAIKRAQYRLNSGGCVISLCDYELLGWSQDNKLYYFKSDWLSDCSNIEGDLWMYDPVMGDKPQRIQRLPDGIAALSAGVRGQRHQDEEERSAMVPNFVAIDGWPGQLVEEAIPPNGAMRVAAILDWSSFVYEVIVVQRADP